MDKFFEIYKDAYLVPAIYDFKGNPKDFIHGIFSAEVGRLKTHLRFGNSLVNLDKQAKFVGDFKQDNIERINGTWFYAGALHHHFGHFIAECMHRLWYYSENKEKFSGIIFLPVHGFPKEMPSYIKSLLHLFSISQDEIKLITGLCQVDNLYTATPGSQLGLASESWYEDELEKKFNFQPHADLQSNSLILSRQNYLKKGRVAGIDYFLTQLSLLNYEIVNPETLPLNDQLSKIILADNIVLEEGSSLHLLELIPRSLLLDKKVMLIKRRVNEQHYVKLISNKFSNPLIYSDLCERFTKRGHVNCLSTLNNPSDLNSIIISKFDENIGDFHQASFNRHEYLDIFSYMND